MVTATNRCANWLCIALMVLTSFCVAIRCEASRGRDPFLREHPRLSFCWSNFADMARWQAVFGDGVAHDADVAMAFSLAKSWPEFERGMWMFLLSVPTEVRDAEPQQSMIQLARESEDMHAHLWLALHHPDRQTGQFQAEIDAILAQRDQFARTGTCEGQWADEVPYLVRLRDFTDEQMRTALGSKGALAVLDAAWVQGMNLYSKLDDELIRRLITAYDMPARSFLLAGVLATRDVDAYAATAKTLFAKVSFASGTVSDSAMTQRFIGETLLRCRVLYLERKAAGRLSEFFTHIEPNTRDVKGWLLVRYHENLIPAIAKRADGDSHINHMLSISSLFVARAPEGTLLDIPIVLKTWPPSTQPATTAGNP